MKRLKKKHIVVLLCAAIALLGMFFVVKRIHKEYQLRHADPFVNGAVILKQHNHTDYYIAQKPYDGEHDIQTFVRYEDLSGLDCSAVMSYEEYHSYCEKWELEEKYHDPDMNYIVFSRSFDEGCNVDAMLSGVEYKGSKATLYLWYSFQGSTADYPGFVCIIPTDRAVKRVKLFNLYSEEEFDYIQRYGVPYDVTEIPWQSESSYDEE